MKCMFSSGNSLDIAACFTHKTIKRHHQHYPKVNLENEDGKQTVRYVLDYANKTLNMEITDENNNIIDINVLAPTWKEEQMDYEYDNNFFA